MTDTKKIVRPLAADRSWTILSNKTKPDADAKDPKVGVAPVDTVKSKVHVIHGKSTKLQRKRGKRVASNLPPPLQTAITVHHVYRFLATAAGVQTYPVSTVSIAGALGGTVYVTDSGMRSWASAVRVAKVTIWPSQIDTGSDNVASVMWAQASVDAIGKEDKKITTLPRGITSSKAVVSSPPKKTLAGDWFRVNGSDADLFYIECQEGSVIDLSVQFTLANDFPGRSISISTTQSAGVTGYTPLDGSGGSLVPEGLSKVL